MAQIKFTDISQVKLNNIDVSRIILNDDTVWNKAIKKPTITTVKIVGANLKFTVRNDNIYNALLKYSVDFGLWSNGNQINANSSEDISINIPSASKGSQNYRFKFVHELIDSEIAVKEIFLSQVNIQKNSYIDRTTVSQSHILSGNTSNLSIKAYLKTNGEFDYWEPPSGLTMISNTTDENGNQVGVFNWDGRRVEVINIGVNGKASASCANCSSSSSATCPNCSASAGYHPVCPSCSGSMSDSCSTCTTSLKGVIITCQSCSTYLSLVPCTSQISSGGSCTSSVSSGNICTTVLSDSCNTCTTSSNVACSTCSTSLNVAPCTSQISLGGGICTSPISRGNICTTITSSGGGGCGATISGGGGCGVTISGGIITGAGANEDLPNGDGETELYDLEDKETL